MRFFPRRADIFLFFRDKKYICYLKKKIIFFSFNNCTERSFGSRCWNNPVGAVLSQAWLSLCASGDTESHYGITCNTIGY